MGVCGSKQVGAFGVWDEQNGPEGTRLSCSPILRHFTTVGEEIATTMSDAGAATVWEMADQAFNKYAKNNAVGMRKLISRDMVPSPDGKKQFEKLSFEPSYSWMSYAAFGDRVARLATAFVNEFGLKAEDRVLIFAETQLDWITTMLACFRQGATIVTAYATLGEEGVSTSLNQTGATICVCDARLFNVVKKVAVGSKGSEAAAKQSPGLLACCQAPTSCPGLRYVVPICTAADPMSPEDMEKELPEGILVRSTDQLVAGAGDKMVEPEKPTPEDVAVIMYTSGTTGASKGVMITHKNIVTQCESTCKIMPFIDSKTVYIAYLPLAHIMELFIECGMLCKGAAIGFGSPTTLTSTGVKLAKGQEGDAPTLKPTVMVFAPAVMDKVYMGVKDKVAKKGGAAETLFNQALQSGYKNYDAGGVGCGYAAWNLLMYNAVQSLIGGRVQHIITGSAPLSAEIQKFAQSCFNCPVRQGYGLTETIAASCVADPTDNTVGQVGAPAPGTFLRLRDWPEGGYTNADVDKPEIGMRRGEVLIGGPTVSLGYLIDSKNPDKDIQQKNKEDFVTIDGVRYFCTGDVGQVNNKGCLAIIDRKKDLFKGDNGEYVSLSKVESFVKLAGPVEFPMVYGRTGAKTVIALICPKKFAIEAIAKEKGIEVVAGKFDELCKHEAIVDEVTKAVLKECKAGGLHGFETPSAIVLCATPSAEPAWTPENEMLTTTMKLKRPVVAKAFEAEITDAYKRSGQ